MQVTKFNLWDLINLVKSQKFQREAIKRYNGYAVTNPRFEFTGLKSIDDIDNILNAEVKQNADFKTNERVFDMVPDVCGSVVNLDAYLQGQPEDMFNFVSSDANIVEDLNLWICMAASVKVVDIAAAAQRLKSYVENRPSNVSFNINVRSDYKPYDDRPRVKNRVGTDVYSLRILVASAEDYLTPQVINLLGHPMFYRYFMLRYKAHQLNSNSIQAQKPEGYIDFLTFNKTW